MRTDDPNPPPLNLERFRGPVERARRWLSGREANTRRALALALALSAGAAVVALAISLAGPADPVTLEWIDGGQRFSSGEVVAIRALLAEKRITPVKVDDRGRVAIPLDRMTEVLAALRKGHLGDQTIDEIRTEALKTSLFDGPEERRQRQIQVQERTLEALIEQLSGVVQADVMINPLPAVGLGSRGRCSKALVHLQTEGDRPLPYQTVQTILRLLTSGTDCDLAAEAVTLLGQGQTYLSAGEPARLRHALARAHEEELAEEVRARLAGLDGARVSARLVAGPPAADDGNPPLPPLPPSAAGPGPALISVQVPEGYYRRAFGTIEPGRAPTAEDIEALREQLDAKIRAMVAQAVPAAEFGGVTIEAIADPLPESRPAAAAARPASRTRSWWWTAAAAGAVVALVLAATRRVAARRPTARLPRPPRPPHFSTEAAAAAAGSGSGPGPLERVRELVRLNPEAAAGVLQRWVGQGGRAA